MIKRSLFFPRSDRNWLTATGLYLGVIGCAVAAITWIGHMALTAAGHHVPAQLASADKVPPTEYEASSEVLQSNDDWMRSVRSGEYFRNRSGGRRRQAPSEPPRGVGIFDLFRDGEGDSEGPVSGGGTYKTVCVRLCDGYAFPISFSTTSSSFARDQRTCENSCTSPAKLYVYRNTGTDPSEMYDLRGRPYSALPTANLYQTSYDESCKCRAHPWEQEAQDRHRMYALEAKSRKGDKQARAELNELRAAQPQLVTQQRASNSSERRSRRARRASRED